MLIKKAYEGEGYSDQQEKDTDKAKIGVGGDISSFHAPNIKQKKLENPKKKYRKIQPSINEEKEIEQKQRELVKALFKISAKKYTHSLAIVYDSSGKILLGKSNKEEKKDLWCFPVGGINKGETPEQAAVRECQEETGIKCVSISEAKSTKSKSHVAVVICRKIGGKFDPIPSEFSILKWWDYDEALKDKDLWDKTLKELKNNKCPDFVKHAGYETIGYETECDVCGALIPEEEFMVLKGEEGDELQMNVCDYCYYGLPMCQQCNAKLTPGYPYQYGGYYCPQCLAKNPNVQSIIFLEDTQRELGEEYNYTTNFDNLQSNYPDFFQPTSSKKQKKKSFFNLDFNYVPEMEVKITNPSTDYTGAYIEFHATSDAMMEMAEILGIGVNQLSGFFSEYNVGHPCLVGNEPTHLLTSRVLYDPNTNSMQVELIQSNINQVARQELADYSAGRSFEEAITEGEIELVNNIIKLTNGIYMAAYDWLKRLAQSANVKAYVTVPKEQAKQWTDASLKMLDMIYGAIPSMMGFQVEDGKRRIARWLFEEAAWDNLHKTLKVAIKNKKKPYNVEVSKMLMGDIKKQDEAWKQLHQSTKLIVSSINQNIEKDKVDNLISSINNEDKAWKNLYSISSKLASIIRYSRKLSQNDLIISMIKKASYLEDYWKQMADRIQSVLASQNKEEILNLGRDVESHYRYIASSGQKIPEQYQNLFRQIISTYRNLRTIGNEEIDAIKNDIDNYLDVIYTSAYKTPEEAQQTQLVTQEFADLGNKLREQISNSLKKYPVESNESRLLNNMQIQMTQVNSQLGKFLLGMESKPFYMPVGTEEQKYISELEEAFREMMPPEELTTIKGDPEQLETMELGLPWETTSLIDTNYTTTVSNPWMTRGKLAKELHYAFQCLDTSKGFHEKQKKRAGAVLPSGQMLLPGITYEMLEPPRVFPSGQLVLPGIEQNLPVCPECGEEVNILYEKQLGEYAPMASWVRLDWDGNYYHKSCVSVCLNCKKELPLSEFDESEDSEIVEGYCNECYLETVVKCENCGEEISETESYINEEGETYCDDCFYSVYIICDNCGVAVDRDDVHIVEGAEYCENCFPEEYKENEESLENLENIQNRYRSQELRKTSDLETIKENYSVFDPETPLGKKVQKKKKYFNLDFDYLPQMDVRITRASTDYTGTYVEFHLSPGGLVEMAQEMGVDSIKLSNKLYSYNKQHPCLVGSSDAHMLTMRMLYPDGADEMSVELVQSNVNQLAREEFELINRGQKGRYHKVGYCKCGHEELSHYDTGEYPGGRCLRCSCIKFEQERIETIDARELVEKIIKYTNGVFIAAYDWVKRMAESEDVAAYVNQPEKQARQWPGASKNMLDMVYGAIPSLMGFKISEELGGRRIANLLLGDDEDNSRSRLIVQALLNNTTFGRKNVRKANGEVLKDDIIKFILRNLSFEELDYFYEMVVGKKPLMEPVDWASIPVDDMIGALKRLSNMENQLWELFKKEVLNIHESSLKKNYRMGQWVEEDYSSEPIDDELIDIVAKMQAAGIPTKQSCSGLHPVSVMRPGDTKEKYKEIIDLAKKNLGVTGETDEIVEWYGGESGRGGYYFSNNECFGPSYLMCQCETSEEKNKTERLWKKFEEAEFKVPMHYGPDTEEEQFTVIVEGIMPNDENKIRQQWKKLEKVVDEFVNQEEKVYT